MVAAINTATSNKRHQRGSAAPAPAQRHGENNIMAASSAAAGSGGEKA